MRIISKILYGLISLSIFTVYKIENAFGAITATLATESNATAAKCSTYPEIGTVRNSIYLYNDIKLCPENYHLTACQGKTVKNTSYSLLGSICSGNNATCEACPNGGKVAASYKQALSTSLVTICSWHGFTGEGLGIAYLGTVKLQTYNISVSDKADYLDIGILENCYIPANTTLSDGTGTYTNSKDCYYE